MKRIRTLEQLAKLAKQRRAVTFIRCPRPMPAAFMLNMTGGMIINRLAAGTFLYRKPKNKHERKS